MDAMAALSTPAAREEGALYLLVKDTCTLITMFKYLPWLFTPFRTVDTNAEFYLNRKSRRELVLQLCLFLIQTVLVLLGPLAWLVLPGGIFTVVAALCCLAVYALSFPMTGSRIVYSQLDDAAALAAKDYKKERWIYINGCMTSHDGLQNNVNYLGTLFGREFVGIHNRTLVYWPEKRVKRKGTKAATDSDSLLILLNA